MKTNNPEIDRYSMQAFGSLINPIRNGIGAWVAYTDYEALQAECEQLRKRAIVAGRERSEAVLAMKGLEELAKVVSDNSDEICAENNRLKLKMEKLLSVIIEVKGHVGHYAYGGSRYSEPADKVIALIDSAIEENHHDE